MSVTQHFLGRARAEGLLNPGVGRAVAHTHEYQQIEGRRQARAAWQRQLLARPGQSSVAGLRLDAASKTPRLDAVAYASAVEWAEYLAGRFGGRVQDHLDGGRHYAMSYMTQLHGHPGQAYRADATVPMASQGLTYIIPEVYRIQHVELPFWEERILKTYRGIDPAANNYVWYETDNVGVARVASSYDVTTIPMVNGPIASDNMGNIIPALVGYETNFMDPRREAMGVRMGKPDFQVEVMKREAAERALAEFFDNLWFGGDVSHGIDGLMNNPIVQTMSVTGGAWAGKTALQILDDLKQMVWAIPNRTMGGLPDLGKVTIWLPPTQYQMLLQPITAAGSTSILDYFISTFRSGEMAGRGVPNVTYDYRFAATNSYAYNGGPTILAEDTALIVYQEGNQERDPTFVLSQPIEVPAPVRTTGVGDVTYFHARGGGLRLPDARRLIYVVGL
jgi:hypothetical protein